MNKIILGLLILISHNLFSQTLNKDYDSTLAKSLNADKNGMKKYVLVMLKTGSRTYEKAQQDSLFRGHMANINRLAADGKLVVAGPLGKNDQSYRGIFILNASDVEEAKQLVLTDPAVKAEVFSADFFIWYGSAALQETLKTHKKIEMFSNK